MRMKVLLVVLALSAVIWGALGYQSTKNPGGAIGIQQEATSDWKTYTSSIHKLSLKYPPNWYLKYESPTWESPIIVLTDAKDDTGVARPTDDEIFILNYPCDIQSMYGADFVCGANHQVLFAYNPNKVSRSILQAVADSMQANQ